jgi:hypothetical protein
MLSALGDTLIVAAPAKLALTDRGKFLVILTHGPASPHAAAAAIVAHHAVLGASAVSTTSIRSVHNSGPVVPSVTHTVTEILHPVPENAIQSHPHPQHPPHPASTVNGHSLGYGHSHLVVAPLSTHYAVHVGGYGVGIHLGGHGHGHGFWV